jgi:hypothetical protein
VNSERPVPSPAGISKVEGVAKAGWNPLVELGAGVEDMGIGLGLVRGPERGAQHAAMLDEHGASPSSPLSDHRMSIS